jgi:2-polyprenyl-6-methoxyphenol hydroxylase-like FAD-dependent oxidoreductase
MSPSDSRPDVVIVGAGIAGSALAISLARSGHGVTLLEKSTVHVDRVRGEFIVPWGVAEAKALGILDLLESAGANYTVRQIPYGEDFPPQVARKYAVAMDQMVAGIRGALNLGHPRICNVLNEAAVAAGATLLRGVDRIQVKAGLPPHIEFTHSGEDYALSPRIVIGADGRGSAVARQAGFERHADPIHHILTGLLVEDSSQWPDNEQSIGVDGDLGFYILPQGQGRVRLYATHGLDQRNRFAGDGAAERFLQAFDRPSLPHSDSLSKARPAGPCHGYPNNDVWIDNPVAPGVILIGDAASHSDPSGGQGISIALKDARLVSEALEASKAWTPEAFAPYASQRREQMRRIRFCTRLLATYRMEFTDAARQRRQDGRRLMAADPELALPFVAMQKGPFAVPSEVFSQTIWQRLLGDA